METMETTSQQEQYGMGLGDYLSILRRRKHWIIWPAAFICLLSVAVALYLPNVYKSEATILIEGKQVTDALVPSTVTTYADQRIQTISQQVMSRSKILSLVEKFGLYPEAKEKLATDALVEKMQKAIAITPISAEVKTPRSDRPSLVTIAFKLAFSGKDPAQTQRVASELASFFLSQNIQERQETAKGTTDFLSRQAEQAKASILELEKTIATFKKAHLEELPEFMQLNLQKTEKINNDLNNLTREMTSLREQEVTTRQQVASLDPQMMGYDPRSSRVPTNEEQLQQLELKLVQLKSRYSPEHPAVIAAAKEIELLKEHAGASGDLGEKEKRLEELTQQLAALKSRYSEKHPSVKRAQAEVEQLKREVAQSGGQNGQASDIGDATNPAYVTMKAQLDRIQIGLKSLDSEKKRLLAEREDIYAKLKTMPEVERRYKELMLDYDNNRKNLAELQQKLQVARVAEGMEEGQLGEKFTIIEPPSLPDTPYKPNRIAIMLIGLILGVGAGVGLAAVKEFSDDTIRRTDELMAITGYNVLTIIPTIVTPREMRMRRVRTALTVLLVVLVPVAGLAAFHYFVMDLFVLYTKISEFISGRFYLHI